MAVSMIVGLGFGDEGKGSTVDHLTRLSPGPVTVVRYSGGAQCGHGVTTQDGRHHTFRQFGSGTFAGAFTFLSRHMLVNPITLQLEAEALYERGVTDPLGRISLDREALVTNLYQIAANRLAETLRGKDRHGSCGMGIGETVEDSIANPEMALKVGDLLDRSTLLKKLTFSRGLKVTRFAEFGLSTSDPHWAAISQSDVEAQVDRYHALGKLLTMVDRDRLRRLLAQRHDLIFEGAQGVLLDQDYGFHPYTTWTNTTFDNAFALLNEAGFDSAQARRIGILRGYSTRHGAGPFPTEDVDADILGDRDNTTNEFQQAFRIGHFDAVLAQYARRVVGNLDEIVLTNLDKIKNEHPKICTGYRLPLGVVFNNLPVQARPVSLAFQEQLTRDLEQAQPIYRELRSKRDLVTAIHIIMRTPVSYCSSGPTAADKLTAQQYLEGHKWN